MKQNGTGREKRGPLDIDRLSFLGNWPTCRKLTLEVQLTMLGSVDGKSHFLKWLAPDFPLGRAHSSWECVGQSVIARGESAHCEL